MAETPLEQPLAQRRAETKSTRQYSLVLHRLAAFDYANPDHAIFVTIRARRGTAPFQDPRLANVVKENLEWLRENRSIVIYAWCLMPDHLHLLLRLPDRQRPLGHIIGALKSFTARRSWSLGYRGQLWQERYYDHIVRKSEDGQRIAEYVRQNPVRKGLVKDADSYEWSGLPDPM